MSLLDFSGSHINERVQPPAANRPMGWAESAAIPAHWIGKPEGDLARFTIPDDLSAEDMTPDAPYDPYDGSHGQINPSTGMPWSFGPNYGYNGPGWTDAL